MLIDGVPLTRLGGQALRDQVGVVMQDDMLLSGTIADNIAFFTDRPDLQHIQRCAALAAIHDDITAMPMGYDTLIGDMGSALSGGQRQRLLLARALYRRPRILVMDEGTSHLDVATEAHVNASVAALGLTRIVVAHRPETIASADRVLVFEAGRLHKAHARPRGREPAGGSHGSAKVGLVTGITHVQRVPHHGEPGVASGARHGEFKMDGATLSDHNVGHDVEAQRRDYTHALLSEVRLLVRTISNDPTKRVSDLKLSYTLPGAPGPKELTAPEIINEISEIEEHADQQLGIARIGFLQLVRDALVSLTAPATGLTISYTTLVAGDQRSQSAESALALARKAYPLLGDRAVRHRRVASFLTVVAIVFTLFAAWEATKASLGKSLLQNLDLLRTQQAAIAAEKLKLETSLDRPAGDADLHIPADGRIPLQAVPLCDRYRLRGLAMPNMPENLKSLRLEASPAERELCGRDTVLVRNLEIVHFSLQQYQEFWPASVGGVVAAAGKLFSIFNPLQHAVSGPTCRTASAAASEAVQPGGEPAKDQNNRSATCDDVEFMIAPMLQITTNYILPITFGFVGSLLYVLLDHFTKLRANTLSPRDFPLMILRLVIGLVVAACVSLLVSSSATSGAAIQGSASGLPATGTLLASLTLSASGITFLAGFGAEAVVILLQSLVTHLFATQK